MVIRYCKEQRSWDLLGYANRGSDQFGYLYSNASPLEIAAEWGLKLEKLVKSEFGWQWITTNA